MLEYRRLVRNWRKLLALTGLTRREFQSLLPAFVDAYQSRYEGDKTLAGRKVQLPGRGWACWKNWREQSRSCCLFWFTRKPIRSKYEASCLS